MPRERKAPELHVLHGNPSNLPAKGVPTSMTGRPTPPADLKGEAFAEWSRITSYLAKVGQIESVDYAALVVYCSAWAMFDAARKAYEQHGPLVTGRDGGLVKNPAAQIMRDASDVMLKFGAKFGFTPKDRQNLGISNGSDSDDDLEKGLQAL